MVISCCAMGRSSDDATKACFRRAVRRRRSVTVPRWRARRLEWAERLLLLLVACFLVVECFLDVAPSPLPEAARPASGTAATNKHINPARQAVRSLEGKIREIRTLI